MKKSLALALTVVSCTSFAANLIDLSQTEFRTAKSPAYQLKLIHSQKDRAGNTHIRYEQTYNDIPVYGYHVLEHQYNPSFIKADLALKPYTGTYVTGLETDLPAQRSVMSADPNQNLSKLKAAYAQKHKLAQDQLVYENESARTVIFIDDQNRAQLAHEINFYVETVEGGSPSRPHYLVDANTGKIIEEWEGLTTQHIGEGPGGNSRTGLYYYGKNYPALDVTKTRRKCAFESASGETLHMKNRMTGSPSAYSYNCARSTVQDADAINGAASPLNDAHFFMDVITAYYQERYNKAPLPFPLVMRTHFGRDYVNAFWNGSSMTYGDGNEDIYPFVLLDVAAHEVSHGVTEKNSNLTYKYQSGGINEAFSDMASQAVEYTVTGSNRWTIGADLFKDLNIEGMRFMDNPPKDGRSIDNAANYTDSMDVHYTSGVFNKAFYLLASTQGWNPVEAFDVMYYANVGYWQPNSTFAGAAWGVIQATAAQGKNVDDVVNAFNQVGIKCDKLAGKCV